MTEGATSKFDTYFATLDVRGVGKITRAQAAPLFDKSGLPEETLSVTYDDVARDSTFGAAAVLHGEASAYDVKSPFLRRTPTITWPDAYVKNAAVLFIDIDAPSRPKGPYVHLSLIHI